MYRTLKPLKMLIVDSNKMDFSFKLMVLQQAKRLKKQLNIWDWI